MVWQLILRVVIQLAIAYGAQKLQQKRQEAEAKKQAKKNAGRKLSVAYGEIEPREVQIGIVCTAGQEVYRNTFGKNNKWLEIVYRLSDWYETSLERITIDGKWVTPGTPNANGYRPISTGDYAGRAWVKFYDGRQTAADAQLIANSNPAGRWTADHIGYGVSYVIVRVRQRTKNPLNEPNGWRFERKGAPLYDWRKDDTAGGTGSHRWNDVSTWEFSEDPNLAAYCYARGGFQYGGDTFVGMDIEPDWLPLDHWSAAADLCDEEVSFTEDGQAKTEARYRVSYALSAGIDHSQNLDNLLDACAGMIVPGVTAMYPVINALGTSVATLTDADLIDGEPIEFDRDGSFSDRVNSVRGTYAEPDNLYEDTGYSPIISAAAKVLDRRDRDESLDLRMVPSKRQAEQLATVYLNETRFPATRTCTVDPKWQVLEPGVDWITWQDDVDGQNRLYQIMGIKVLADDGRVPRAVTLDLMERHPDIYNVPTVIDRPPPIAAIGDPEFINEALNFGVSATVINQENGPGVRPVFYCTWDIEDDDTVDDVLIEYWPKDQPNTVFSEQVPYDVGRAFLQKGVVSSTTYEVRHKLVSAVRDTVYAAADEVTSLDATLDTAVILGNLGEDIREKIANLRADMDALQQRQLPDGFQDVNLSLVDGFRRTMSVSARAQNAQAAVLQEITARAAGDAALAEILTGVTAANDLGSAQGLIALTAEAAPAGYDARFAVAVRAATGETHKIAGLYLDVQADANGGASRAVLVADQTVISNDAGDIFGLFDEDGFLVPGRLTADNINAGTMRLGDGTSGPLLQVPDGSGGWKNVMTNDGSALVIDGDIVRVAGTPISNMAYTEVVFFSQSSSETVYDADFDLIEITISNASSFNTQTVSVYRKTPGGGQTFLGKVPTATSTLDAPNTATFVRDMADFATSTDINIEANGAARDADILVKKYKL